MTPPATAHQSRQNSYSHTSEVGEANAARNDSVSSLARRPSPIGKSWAHFVAGAFGGMTAAIATNPLDVLKTRLQSDFYQSQLATARAARGIPPLHTLPVLRSASLHIRETFQILFAVPRVEGWRALFRGLGPALIGVVPARAINFYTYGNGKRMIALYANNGKDEPWVQFCAAVSAGVITGTATCPIWVIKTRMQLDKTQTAERAAASNSIQHRRYKGALDCTMQTLRQEGLRGLYRGLGASYLGVSESTIQWVLYEQMKSSLAQRNSKIAESGHQKTSWDVIIELGGNAASAGLAKTFAAVLTYPHEVVRTRLRQAPLHDGRIKYTGIVQCIRLIIHEEGLIALYGGLVPHMLRVVPSAAIMFGSYEGILRLMGTDSSV